MTVHDFRKRPPKPSQAPPPVQMFEAPRQDVRPDRLGTALVAVISAPFWLGVGAFIAWRRLTEGPNRRHPHAEDDRADAWGSVTLVGFWLVVVFTAAGAIIALLIGNAHPKAGGLPL